MGNLLGIAISGLKAQQAALTVTGNNITNAGTEGYSRQVVRLDENSAQYSGGVWIGSGVSVDSVTRVYDEFLTRQLRSDTSTYYQYESLASNAGAVDGLLADSETGIQPALEDYFGALQTVVDDPSSIAAREVLLSEANTLGDRFKAISDQLNEINEVINGQLKTMADGITSIAASIAELNKEIKFAYGASQGAEPSTLLDQRDALLLQLSEIVDVSVVELDDYSVNVSIGSGQALVLGNDYNRLYASSGAADPSRTALYFSNGSEVLNITGSLSGGELGGTLDFRDQVLDPTMNTLGKLSLVMAESINEQHALGLDYNSLVGGDFFTDINSEKRVYSRVLGDDANADPDDRDISVHITDAGSLTTSDYTLEFIGPDNYNYRITRVDDGERVATGAITGAYPEVIEVDGFDIHLDGGSFQAGDDFLIMPTRKEASELDVSITDPEEIALASPIITDAAIGNTGTAEITQGAVVDLDTTWFNEDGELDPPLIIVFTSATTYDVLDNSDPANPRPLSPPIENQSYVSGISNTIYLGAPGETVVSSYGGVLADAAVYQAPSPAAVVDAVNGFSAARINITYTDPETGQTSTAPTLDIDANTSAKDIARQLSRYEGVDASAVTTLQLTDFTSDESDNFLAMGVSLNGIELTDNITGNNQTKYAEGYPQDVPDPMTPDFLADRINACYELQELGISARSDGVTLTITAINGDDLDLDVRGDKGDGFSVSNGNDIVLQETGSSPYIILNEYDGYDFTVGGPYTYEFEVSGQGTFSITLDENYADGDALLAGITARLEDAGFAYSGELDIAISESGQISFQPRVDVRGTGIHGSSKFAMGGQIKIVLDEHYSMSSEPPGSNLFAAEPEAVSSYSGIDIAISGVADAGDKFTIGFNDDAISDNRNGAVLLSLQNLDTSDGNSTYSEVYSTLVETVGSVTSRAQTNRDTSEAIMSSSQDAVSSVSGVNLDEEAAALIQYELVYNANAKVIQVAQDIFDTLISSF